MNTLNDYAAAIQVAAQAGDASALAEISQTIRKTLWNNRESARALVNLADDEARKSNPFHRRLPRWESYADAAGNLHREVR